MIILPRPKPSRIPDHEFFDSDGSCKGEKYRCFFTEGLIEVTDLDDKRRKKQWLMCSMRLAKFKRGDKRSRQTYEVVGAFDADDGEGIEIHQEGALYEISKAYSEWRLLRDLNKIIMSEHE